MSCCICIAFTADCSSFVHEGEEHTIECNITNCTISVSRDNVVWCLNYCGTKVECDLSRSLCINSNGITNTVGETPTSIRNNIEVTNSGGLQNAHVAHELRNTTYNCSVVDNEGNVCGPQSFAFMFRGSSKLTCLQISCYFFLVAWGILLHTYILCIFPHNTCITLFFTH